MVRYEAVQKFRSAHSAAPTDTCRSLRTFSATTRMLQRGSFWPALITPSSANRSMNPWGQLRLACKDFLTRANFSRKAKTNAILLSRSRHGLDSGDRRKGRSDPRYLHDERRHSLEARRSQEPPWTGDVRGVGESERGRLVDPAKVSRGHGLGLALAHRGVSGRRDPGQVHAYFRGSSRADKRARMASSRASSKPEVLFWANWSNSGVGNDSAESSRTGNLFIMINLL